MVRMYDDFGNTVDIVKHDNKIYNRAIGDFMEKLVEVAEPCRPVGWVQKQWLIQLKQAREIGRDLLKEVTNDN